MTVQSEFVFHFGGHECRRTVHPGEAFDVFTEDTFGGRLTSPDGKPRSVAPYPWVNPLTGPIAIEGVREGDVLAVHLASLRAARDWGVATVSPNFGLLSGTLGNPNLQPELDERVWIWRVSEDGNTLHTTTASRVDLQVPFQPFFGTIGIAPAHGEVRLSVTPGEFGGNLDLPDLGPAATLYLRSNVDGGHLYLGDGHFAQGDGEITGTAVEGALDATLIAWRVGPVPTFDWPRMETDRHLGVIGCARPLEDAVRIAASGMVRWLSELSCLDTADAHQLVSQSCELRIGNLVNPTFSVCCRLAKHLVPNREPIMGDAHRKLAEAAWSRTPGEGRTAMPPNSPQA